MSKRLPMIVGLLLVLIYFSLSIDPPRLLDQVINRMENLSYDLQLRISLHHLKKSSIVIVDIDDKSLKELGRWPWSRDKIAKLVQKIHAYGAAIIAMDIFFSEQEENAAKMLRKKLSEKNQLDPKMDAILKIEESSQANDLALSEQIKKSPSILAIGFLHKFETLNTLPEPLFKISQETNNELNFIQAQGYISNIPIVQNAAQGSGFINIYPDPDGIIRRAPMLIA